LPELTYRIDRLGDVTFAATGHRYRVLVKKQGRPSVTLTRNGTVLEDDRFDPHDERERRRFAGAAGLNGAAEAVVRELKVLAGLLDDGKAGRRPAAGEAPGAVEHEGRG
jgi:hypothetical protein